MAQYEYLTTEINLEWDGGDFYLRVEVEKDEMNIDALGAEGWELVGFFPDAHAIGDIKQGYKDGRDGWVPPNVRVGVFKREIKEGGEPSKFKRAILGRL